jgi:hypothetical protein
VKKATMVLMIFFVSTSLFSYEYIMNTNPSGIGPLTGNVQITTLAGGNWDDGYADLAIPAVNQFYYYGKLITQLRIFTNGVVHLFSGSTSLISGTAGNFSIPYPGSNLNNIVAPLWDDWRLAGATNGAGEIWYQIYNGVSNNNYIIVEWRGVRHYGTTDTAYTFACAFCCSNNPYYANGIAFYYADVDTGNAIYDNGLSATVGIENSTGTIGEQYSYNEAIVNSGMRILFTPFVPIYGSTTDTYAGTNDGHPDAIVFRPGNGDWYYYNSDGSTRTFHWGAKGDVPVPGDYDGDGDADECVFRPSNGYWYCPDPSFSMQWGTSGDIPVPADYNGDGSLDIAVFRPSNGTWYVYIRGSGTVYSWKWGQSGDIPLPADYDSDHYADLAVFRPANNTWYIRKSWDWSIVEKQWGTEGDIPLPANFDLNGFSTLAVFRPSNGYWYSLNQGMNTFHYSQQWGQDGDVPVPADQNTNGVTDPTVFRPANGYWYLSMANYLPSSFQWGTLGDKPRFRNSFLLISPPPTSGGPDQH